ncbi:5'-3' exoribonuclease [Spironucleus salmonicida]|uniref:5'-3' exoribonuclease n=1 Tax=Spironucleus salmonicida TaxID=348837 RepID=V6LRY8_9EUKA|nr:5'-3' exoribonuclease [Spironucleus salmonicida]|eukprot:EST46456.1 5'-3' exoribonuclease [Spironucleus salmonicida]
MGVPRLNRFICERFPYAIRSVTRNSHQVDHLYIDFNGLIHESTLRSSYASINRAEDVVFQQTFSYFLYIVELLAPKTVYIAIDGAAPSAKIRQQRQRRVFGAIQADSQSAYRRNIGGYGDMFNKVKSVSGAEITPGTEFMSRLQSFLVLKIAESIDSDILQCSVEFSGSDEPGEGEHKILNEIRRNIRNVDVGNYFTNSTKYIPEVIFKKKLKLNDQNQVDMPVQDVSQQKVVTVNTEIDDQIDFTQKNDLNSNEEPLKIPSHCVFGLDGDLILLLLGLNIPEITLVKRFTGLFVSDFESVQESKNDPWNNGIIAMDIDSVREGIIYEILQNHFEDEQQLINLCETFFPQNSFLAEFKLKTSSMQMPSQFRQFVIEKLIWADVSSRIIHDFIALALFVGNDFLPEVPGQSIKNGALDQFIDLYKQENVKKLPFKFLLSQRKQIDLSQICQMFTVIGDKIEFKQVLQDIKNFSQLASKVKELSDNFKAHIIEEYQQLKDDISIDILNNLRTANINKIQNDNRIKPVVMNYYRQKYYAKFDQLNIKNQIRCPVGLNKKQLKSLAILDHYENLIELNQPISHEHKTYIKDNMTCLAFKGMHNLIRTYLKTMQWVIDYYLDPQGITQWNWEFPYPFTPLCSDMGVYCKLFALDIQIWNEEVILDKKLNKIMDANRQKVESVHDIEFDCVESSQSSGIGDVENIDADTGDLEMGLLKGYVGPQFLFTKDKPHDVLTALIFTLSKQKMNLVPQEILQKIDKQFFDSQPTYKNVNIIHYESAFQSLNQTMDLSRPNLNFLDKRGQTTLGFGWTPNFTVFYKHYPIGLTDGIDFVKVEKMLEKVDQNTPYYQAFYQSIGNIIIAKNTVRNDPIQSKLDKFQLVASPGTCIEINKSKASIDPKHIVILPLLNKKLSQTFIYIPKSTSLQVLNSVFYASFFKFEQKQIPIFDRTFVSKYRGLHLINENAQQFSKQNQQLNIISQGIRGNCLKSSISIQKSKSILQEQHNTNFSNSLSLTNEIDAFIEDYIQFDVHPHKQQPQIIPDHIITEIEEHIEVKYDTNQLVSYENDYYGQILGYFCNNQLFLRTFTNINSNIVLGSFSEQTFIAEKVLQQLKITIPLKQVIYNKQTAYYTQSKGRSISDAQEIIVFLINEKFVSHEAWLMALFQTDQLNPSHFSSLAFLDQLPVTFSPLYLLHRKTQRTQFLRSRIEKFAFVVSSNQELSTILLDQQTTFLSDKNQILISKFTDKVAQELSSVLIGNFNRIIPKKAIKQHYKNNAFNQVISRSFDFNLPKLCLPDTASLSYSQSIVDIQVLQKALQIKVSQKVLFSLLSYQNMTCVDRASRDLGLNVYTKEFYDPNYIHNGKITKRCALALIFICRAFPKLVKRIVCLRENGNKLDHQAFDCGTKDENFLNLGDVQTYNFNQNQLPIYDQTPDSQLQLANIISVMSLYIQKFIVPLEKKMLIPRSFQHYSGDIVKSLSEFTQNVSLVKSDIKSEIPNREAFKFALGDVIFSAKFGICAVVGISGTKFRFVANRHLYNYNDCYQFNAYEDTLGEKGYYLLKKGLVKLTENYEEFNIGAWKRFVIDESKEIDQWLVAEKNDGFSISFD